MYHTARKAEFQQSTQSVALTAADDYVFVTNQVLFRLMQLALPGFTTSIVVCTLHTLWSIPVI